MAEARNLRISRIVLALLAFSLIALPTHAQYGGGTGEPNYPYLIYTPEQMNAIGTDPNDWNKHFKLMADIDLGGLGERQWHTIGTELNTPFRGTFDGDGHTISNFVHASASITTAGLFALVADPNAEIRNLRLIAPRVTGSARYMGSLVGWLRQGILFNCHAQDVDIQGCWDSVGGLVGASGPAHLGDRAPRTTIRGCSSSGRISGGFPTTLSTAGGLVGEDWYGTFCDCCGACEVSDSESNGGLVGRAEGTRLVSCYALGDIRGGNFAGGLLGISSSATVIDCYSAGHVTEAVYAGGFIGAQGATQITASFWDASVNDPLKGIGGSSPPKDPQAGDQLNDTTPIGRTTAQMQDPNTFRAAGWDFVGEADGPSDIWAEPPGGGYPILWWQLLEPPKLPFAGGTGGPDDPYLIATGEQLNSIGHNPRLMAAHFRVTNDIDLSGLHFYLIGNEEYPFAGVFDGGNFGISNFTYAAGETDYVGLFRIIADNHAEVRNVRLVSPVVGTTNMRSAGALVGWLGCGTLRNCYVEGGRVSGSVGVGGLVGWSGGPYRDAGNYLVQLFSCGASATVVGQRCVGGLIGDNGTLSTVADCSSGGQVIGGRWVGGLVGHNAAEAVVERSLSTASIRGTEATGGLAGGNAGTITNCYSTGNVSGRKSAGGLVGSNGEKQSYGDLPGIISNCYTAGGVAGKERVGGLVGYQVVGSVTACFWDANTSGLAPRITEDGAKTTAEMQTASTFLNAGWDFVGETANGTEEIWWILEGQDYPRLSWERSEAP
jgi:hypothetical protein